MAGLGFAAIVMSCLLCCTTVRDAHRTMVGMLDAIMILLQSFCGTAAFASWFFVQQWINRDLNQFYPGKPEAKPWGRGKGFQYMSPGSYGLVGRLAFVSGYPASLRPRLPSRCHS
jgi:hypothetical protein